MDDEPFDALDAAVIALWQLYDALAAEPLDPLRDDDPAPRNPPIDQP